MSELRAWRLKPVGDQSSTQIQIFPSVLPPCHRCNHHTMIIKKILQSKDSKLQSQGSKNQRQKRDIVRQTYISFWLYFQGWFKKLLIPPHPVLRSITSSPSSVDLAEQCSGWRRNLVICQHQQMIICQPLKCDVLKTQLLENRDLWALLAQLIVSSKTMIRIYAQKGEMSQNVAYSYKVDDLQ